MKKLVSLLKKYEEVISYLFFGGLTTLVNYIVYLPCYNLLHLSGALSNAIAWVAAVAFAYVTNKPFVFKSHDWSVETVIPELTKFVSCRVGSGLLETAIIFALVDWLGLNGNVIKLATSVLVVILNYIASKLLVFRKK
jgi:putative flippase GtrA